MPIIVRNPSQRSAPPVPPARPDGTLYRYELLFADASRRAYADTPAQLLDALIPGYAQHDPAAQLQARITFAVTAQVTLQARINHEVGLDGCTDHEVRLLQGPRHEPPTPGVWRAPVPLVLVDSFYQPASDLPRPEAADAGELVWLEPASEYALLRSLHEAGLVQLAEHRAGEKPPR